MISCEKIQEMISSMLDGQLSDEERVAVEEHIALCPETMGKINQLGSLEEVMTLCRVDERILPTIDFGHLNVLVVFHMFCSFWFSVSNWAAGSLPGSS